MGADGPIIQDEGHICPGGEEVSRKDTGLECQRINPKINHWVLTTHPTSGVT